VISQPQQIIPVVRNEFSFFSEFHADPHEQSGLRGIVGEAILFVVHEEIAVAHFCKDIAREIDSNGAAGEPGDLRAGSESADVALERQEEPPSKVNLSPKANDRIDPPLVTGFRGWQTVLALGAPGARHREKHGIRRAVLWRFEEYPRHETRLEEDCCSRAPDAT
jgi:hypothetical protein